MFEVSSKNSKFLYPLLSFSQPPSIVSEENHLDFCKNWVLTKFGWKIKILWFRNDFWVLFISSIEAHINLKNCRIQLDFSSGLISISIGEQARNWARGPKTQKFKVLCFEPNFRGRSNMTSKAIVWSQNIKKPPKNWVIHDLSGKHALSSILGPSLSGSSKFSQMNPKFRYSDSDLS